ncbi:MAG TPA: DsrE/DsrF/DrsH-like family protein [Bacteroidales bacterium]|nr:DsrE/DsrF/DrsH-like family protein [Bacteroidales bacterium]HPE57699.1 DsrE/DsrF/DrsH-like family protein [Bacteroidales bacterium]HRX98197.1 DsrE/DsrF/DrsH-like family protein [Bacteroidales bacterium]
MSDNDHRIKKVSIICAKGTIEDVYASLVMGNGAVMEGMEANLFFTFFGLEAVIKNRMDNLHTGVVGNPAMRLPGGMRMPTWMGIIPGMEAMVSGMMKKEMDKLDVPPVSEFIELFVAGGGNLYACKLAADMFKLKKEDLSEHVTGIITVGEFYELAGGEGSQIIFT